MVSSLRFRYRLVIICYLLQLALYKSGARAENSYLRKKCPNYICNPPSKSDNCDEIEDPSKLSGDEFSFLPEDQCCPVYQCTSADGNGFIGIFSGSNQVVVDTKSEGDEENMCQGVTCKSMPSLGKCSARNATTLASTLVYGPARICCPVFACTHANGTTTMHYGIFIDKDSSQTEIKPAPRPKGRSFLGLIPPSVKVKAKAKPPAAEADSDVFIPDTSDSADEPTVPKAGCAGIFCMTGQPSKDCRKSTPADIKGLMKIQEDCCPTWTCTHSHNGSLYYVHVGMQQKSKFWFVANLANDDDLSSPPVTEPLESGGGSNSSLATVQVLGGNEVSILPSSGAKATEANDLDLDADIGVKTMSLPRTPSPDCPRVECIMAPEKQLRTCSVLSNQNADKFKLLGIQASCCPMFKCIGNQKAFLVQFGMFAAEPSSNSTTTENPNASSMRPQTTMTPTKATTTTAKLMTTTTTTAKPTTTTTTTTEKPMTTTTTTEKPTTTTTITEKPTTTTTTTTEKPMTTTTEKVLMTTVKSLTSTASPIKLTTVQTTEKPASTTTKKLTTTTKKPTTTTKKSTTTTKKPTTTTKKPTTTTKKATITKITTENPTTTSASLMSTVPTTTEIITTTKKAQAQKPQSLSDLVKSNSKTKPAVKTTTANPSKLKTTTPIDEENGEFPSVAGEEIDEDLNSMITNSTVNKPQCKNVQCFPAPSKDTCTVIQLTDCYLIKLLGSAADCCATYKCKSDKGNAIQFGMMDGISETVVSSPISKDDESSPKCSLNMHEVTTKKPKKEKYFEIDVVNSEPKPEKLRPVMIFDFVNNEVSFISYEVRYVKSCTGVSCSPPSGLDIKYCQKLPKGTVPKQMKPLGITSACCFVWKCTMSDGGVSTHYGISQKPSLHIPFEYNGENTDKLPKSLTVKEPESALAVSKCETVLCAPPLRFAVCKIANPSAIKLVKGSLRQKKKCCPVWICRRQEGSTITLYGRTSPKAYNMSNIQSILRGKIFTPEPKDNEIKTPKKAISKPVLKSSMKFGPHSWPHITSTTAEPEEFQTEKPPTKKPTPKNKVKPSNKKPSKPSKIPKPKKAEIKKQLTQQEQLAAMQRDNMDNLKLMQANDQLEDQTSADPDEESSTAEADLDIIDDGASNAGVDVGVNPGSNNRMVQRMQMNGMVMETNMQQSGGPPMPMQNMQLPGMTMTQYG